MCLLADDPVLVSVTHVPVRGVGEVFLDDPDVAIDTNHFHADNRFMPTPRRKPLTDRAAPLGLSA